MTIRGWLTSSNPAEDIPPDAHPVVRALSLPDLPQDEGVDRHAKPRQV